MKGTRLNCNGKELLLLPLLLLVVLPMGEYAEGYDKIG